MKNSANWKAALIVALIFSAVLIAFSPALHEKAQPPVGSSGQPAIFTGRAERSRAEGGMQDAGTAFASMIRDERTAVREAEEKKRKEAEARKARKAAREERKAVLEAVKEEEEAQISNGLYEIMGRSSVTVDQMVSHYEQYSSYPAGTLADGGAPTIRDFCSIIFEEAEAEGVRPEVVYAQSMIETGWLKFQGGADSPSQYNFAGLGTVGDGNPGNSFPDVRTGIRAQVQHLKAYACTDPLNGELVDTRFDMIPRGCAPYVQWLGIPDNPSGIGWAGGAGYGDKIMQMIMKIRAV